MNTKKFFTPNLRASTPACHVCPERNVTVSAFTDIVHDSWPLKLNITLLCNPDGSGTQATTIDQYYERDEETRHNGQATSFSLIQNRVTPTDTLDFAPGFVITGNTNQASAQDYFSSNSTGYCYTEC